MFTRKLESARRL